MLALGVTNAWGEKITDYSKIGTGKTYYIGATTGGTDYYLSVSGASASNSTTIAGTAVTDKTEAATFVFTGSGTSWTIKFADHANYLSLSSSKANGKVLVVSSAATFTASNQSEKLRLSIGSYSIQKNNSGTQFGSYGNTQTDIWLEEVSGSSEPTTQYTIKWHTAKGVTTDVTLNEGATITKPATDPTMAGYEFMGWTASCDVASDGSDFTALTDFGTADSDKDFYAVFAVATTTGGGESTPTEVTDVLNRATTGVTNTSYATWSGKTVTSSAVYAGQSAGGNESIQLRTTNSNSGIVTTASGGKAKKVVVVWHTSTTTGRTIDIYGKNSAYTDATDLYNTSKQGTKLGSIKYGTSTELAISGDYEYIGIRSNSGALYLTSVSITWAAEGTSGGTTTYSDYITTCASDIEFVELGDAFKWSAAEAEVTIDATDNVFPTLTNTHNVPVTYSSSDATIASIDANATVTLQQEGTVTITAKYEGGISAGTGKEYKSKTVTYSLKVNKAVAQPTGTMYVKVTDAVTDGEYLIVYETGNVAFNGALPALDAVSNTIAVEINSNTIAGNTEIDAATFTIASMTDGHSIQSKSGKYIGRTSNSNGMDTGNSAIANVITFSNGAVKIAGSENGSTTSLQYNAASGQTRFRYFATTQKAIALYKKVDPNAVVEPQFKLAAGEYYGTQSVEITCATAGAEVYYTLDGTDPTSTSTKYTGAISIASTTTIKAVAIKGENSSAVVSATYTILAPLATMQAIFDKATAVGGTATPVHITMNNWVVTGVKNNNVYVTDGTKGLIIYTASHGFNVGDILSGTVACKVQLYNGSSELTELTSTTEGLTVTTGGVVTPVVVNDVTTLGGVNTGSVIKITGPCTVDDTKYYVAGVQLYNSLYTYTNPEEGYNYECTGVYLQYNTTKEILPRKAEDLVKIETQQPAGIAFAVAELTAEVGATDFEEPELTNPNSLTVTYKTSDATLATVDATTGEVTIGNKAGKVTITASFAGSDDYVAANASYNITITDPNQLEATFVAGTDKSDTKSISKKGITVEFADGSFSRDDNYRCYAGKSMTISYADGNITKIVIECTANDGAEYGPGQFTTETATYSYSGKVGTWTGEANSVTFTNIKQVRMTAITVYYKQDHRADAGLAWNPATVSLTVGDAFTAPTFSNPNGLTGITFTSDNEALATVTNAGVISLVSGKKGSATITATFAGDATYKTAEVTCVITVNPKSEKVVILAEYNGQWYALKNAEETAGKVLAALPVNYVGGKLYNVADADKETIEWQLAIDGTIATFKNGENYISGTAGSTDMKLSTTECAWTLDGSTYKIGNRTFIYRAQANGFKNYNATTTPGTDDYSNLPVVTAPVYATGDAYGRTVTTGEYGTICIPYGSSNYTGAEFYEISWMEMDGTTPKGIWLDQVNGALTAGKPYIFKATADEIAIVGDGTTAAAPVVGVAGLTGTFTLIQDLETSDPSNTLEGNYMISGNEFLQCGTGCWLNANRAYIDATIIANHTTKKAEIPGRRRVCLGETSENTTTGVDNNQLPNANIQKVIENGQFIIIRDGVKYNVQGVRL